MEISSTSNRSGGVHRADARVVSNGDRLPVDGVDRATPNAWAPPRGIEVAALLARGGMTDETRLRAEKLTCLFENSTTEPQYGYVALLSDHELRGYTAGRCGFCSGTGDMCDVVTDYTQRRPHNPLARYLPELERLAALHGAPGSGEVGHLRGLPRRWAAAADDPVFRHVQDDALHSHYYEPAMRRAEALGVQSALGTAILYDTIVQHGDGPDPDSMAAIIDRTIASMGGAPADGVDERAWLATFVDNRRETLLHPVDPSNQAEWPSSAGRADVLRALVDGDNLALAPFRLTTDPSQVGPGVYYSADWSGDIA